jgi:CRP/FNR family transcriptional regulator, cyclic AMP receptor protein
LSLLLDQLIQRSPKRSFPKNLLIIQEGDQSDSVYILLSGRVRAFSTGTDGREIIFSEYRPTELFGEMALDGGARSASVMTLELSECAIVTRSALESFVAEHPSFAFELISKVIQRARQATNTARKLALHDVYGRLKTTLEEAPGSAQQNFRVLDQKYTHADLAKRIGASREMVSKILKDLEVGGHLVTDGPTWRVFKLPEAW